MKTCARCGLADETVLDLDTGSACHPELRDCIQALVARCSQLEWSLRQWESCCERLVSDLPSAAKLVTAMDVAAEMDALRFDLKAAREILDLANERADTWQQVAVELNHQLSKLQRVVCAVLGGTNAGGCRGKCATG